MALDTAITDATKNVDKDGNILPPPLPKDEQSPKEEEDGLTPEEIKQARSFYRGLKDPEKAPVLIDFIAKQAGYDKIQTKEELKDAKRDIKAILTEKLGDEFEPLIAKLTPALEEILEAKLKESTKDIRTDLAAQQESRLKNESLNVLMGIGKDFYDGKDIPDNVSKEMTTLMDQFEPSKDMTLDKYLKSIHTLALGNLGITTNKNNDRIERNRNDAASRLASERGGSPSEGDTIPKKMSLDMAVREAVKTVQEQNK